MRIRSSSIGLPPWPDALKALDGVTIRVLHDEDATDERRRLLAAAGCSLRRATQPLHILGSMVDAGANRGCAILVDRSDRELRGRVVRSPEDRRLRNLLHSHFTNLWQCGADEIAANVPQLLPVGVDVIKQVLKRYVPQYAGADVAIESIDIGTTLPLTRWLESAKLRRVRQVEKMYGRTGRTRYEPLLIRNSTWLIAPPVIEEIDGRQIVIDGAHRAYSSLLEGSRRIQCVVVRGVQDAPPATVVDDWRSVMPLPKKLDRENRYANYVSRLFRPIKDAWRHVHEDRGRG